MALTLALVAAWSVALIPVAVQPAGAAGLRPYTLRYSNNVNGQITMAANVSLRCPTDTSSSTLNNNCTGARNGTNSVNNNTLDMRWLDVDADPATFDSSSAQLALPAGATVLFAGLYWTGIQIKGSVITNGSFTGVPQPAPNVAQIDRVKLALPGSTTYSTVTASQVDTGPIANGSGYTAFADVTTRVASGGAGTYTVADVQTGTGGNEAAGWSLVVAYADASEPLRNLSVFDGLTVVSGQSSVSIPLAGFKTPSAGTVRTTVGLVAAEGDAGTTGDYLTVNGNVLTDAVHPPNNTENSTIANRGSQVTTKSPDWRNQLGYDASFFVADGYLGNGDTTANFAARTTGDVYAPQAITFATELFSPQVAFTKTAAVVGGGPAEPGATVEYTITATNNGTQQATNVEFADPVPGGTTFVSSSESVTSGSGNASYDGTTATLTARLGAGATAAAGGVLGVSESATVTYRVTIDADRPLGDVLHNVATLSFVSPDLGLPIAQVATADVTVSYPDVGVVKTITDVTGNRYTFALTVTNNGTADTVGTVTLADTLGVHGTLVSIGGTGWTCAGSVSPCDRSDVLTPGSSYPVLTVVADFSAGQPVENAGDLTAASGGQPSAPGSPARLDDHSEVSAGTAAESLVVMQKTALDPVVGFDGSTAFRIDAYNQGTIDSPDTVVTDTVPAGLVVEGVTPSQGTCTVAPGASDTTVVACSLGNLAVGDGAVVTVTVAATAAVAGTTVTNHATVASSTIVSPPVVDADLEVRPATDLAIEKTADVATVNPGDPVEYTLTVTNQGSTTAEEVQVVDHLPPAIDGAATITATPDGGGSCQVTDRVVACDWSSLAASGSVTVTISAQFAASVASDDKLAVNVAEVTSLTDELDPSDNVADVVVRVLPFADLEAAAYGPGVVPPGETATLTFVNTNNGPTTATSAVTEITVPGTLEIVSVPAGCVAAGATVTCTAGTLVAGESHTVEIVVRAPAATVGTTSLTVVHVSSAVDDPIPENDDALTPLETTTPPRIDVVDPPEGPVDGGTPIEIDGENFDSDTTVDIGGQPCRDVVFVTAEQLQCTTPPHDPGPVDVVVTTGDGQTAVLPGGFTYRTPEPTFTG